MSARLTRGKGRGRASPLSMGTSLSVMDSTSDVFCPMCMSVIGEESQSKMEVPTALGERLLKRGVLKRERNVFSLGSEEALQHEPEHH